MKIAILSCAVVAAIPACAALAQESVGSATPPKYDAAVVNPWGLWADLAGTAWIDDASSTSFVYAWQVPGEIMTVTVTGPAGTFVNTFELDADGTGVNLRPDPKLGGAARFTSPRPGVSIQIIPGNPDARMVYRHVGEQVFASQEARVGGTWVSKASQTRRRATDVDVAMVAKKVADARAELDRQWGVLGRMAGSDWKGEVYVRTWWVEPGRKLRMDFHDLATLRRVNWFQFELDERSGHLNETSMGYPIEHTVLADGTVYTDDGLNRGWRFDADGRFTLAKGDAKDGRFVYRKDYLQPATRLSPDEQRALELRVAQVLEAAKREDAAKAESGGSGWGGALAGAIGGLAAAAGAGGDASQMVSAASQGAAMFSDNAAVQATAQATAPMLTGGTAAPALGAIAGGAARSSFPTKPNLATSACAGFTESNYRTKALEGGPDSQLKTMCGEAFEYYTMYKRAIAQGYSEADCNRTYAAHEQSARVAQSFANGG